VWLAKCLVSCIPPDGEAA